MNSEKPLRAPLFALLTTGAILLASAVYAACIATLTRVGDSSANAWLSILFLGSWLVPVCFGLFLAIPAVVRGHMKLAAAWFGAAAASVVMIYLFDSALVECDVSQAVMNRGLSRLTIKERGTVQRDRYVCPTSFTYLREDTGKTECVFGAADFIHGTKVYVGCG